jgi:signal transduction histidine kinase
MAIARRLPRQLPIRVLLALIFVVPLVSLLALWGFAASVTVSNAIQEHNFSAENQLFGGAAQVMDTQLEKERLQAFDWLSSGRTTSKAPMLAQFHATDVAVTAFRNGINVSPGIGPSTWPALRAFESTLGRLVGLRAQIESGGTTPLAAFQAYNSIVNSQFALYGKLVVVNNVPLYQQAAASVEAGRALELAAREVTLLTGTLASGGQMSRAERLLFAQIVANRQLLMADALRELDPSLGSGYQHAESSQAYKSFAAIESQIVDSIGARGPIHLNGSAFGAATVALFADYQKAQAQDRIAIVQQGTQVGNRLLLEVVLAGGLGLLAVLLSIYLMLRFARRLSRELTGLQGAALDLAQDRLPRVVARLGQGEDVDVAAEAAPLAPGRIREIAKVTEAFSSVQRTAVEAAVGQARLRRGVSQVFRNLAWRSQSLLHRQLAMLDAMERRSAAPETLAELFQLDHLTTRMRRHAEGLLILSGSSPGRGWRHPVPLVDVIRGAVAEVEDYTRVSVLAESEDAVIGTAVADVIHLLAELIENAALFSPAGTEVTVRAGRVAKGVALEVEDRGVGITEEDLGPANDRLATAPEFDLAESDQLGLFVVARLAARHGIRVTLRSSPFGGTTAVVLLPHTIMVAAADTPAIDAWLRDRDPLAPVRPMLETLVPQPGRRAVPYVAADDGADPAAAWRWPATDQANSLAGSGGTGSAGLAPALPRRVRQASLAPQLKTPGTAPSGEVMAGSADGTSPLDNSYFADTSVSADATVFADATGGDAHMEPTDGTDSATVPGPAESRALGDSLQRGWQRARADAERLDDVWAAASSNGDAGLSEDREGT